MSIRILKAYGNDSSVLVPYVFADVLIPHSGELKKLFLHIVPFASRKHTRINVGFFKFVLVLQSEIRRPNFPRVVKTNMLIGNICVCI